MHATNLHDPLGWSLRAADRARFRILRAKVRLSTRERIRTMRTDLTRVRRASLLQRVLRMVVREAA